MFWYCSSANGSEGKPNKETLLQSLPESSAMLAMVCYDVIHPSDFFQKFPESEKVIDVFGVGIHKDYKRQGIATTLVKKSMEVKENIFLGTTYLIPIDFDPYSYFIFKAAESIGCDGAFIIATSKYTNGIAKKLDMNLYRTVYWRDYHGWYSEEKMPCPDVNSYYKFF